MTNRLRWRWICTAFASICLAMGGWYLFVAPKVLRLAVGPEGGPMYRHARAIAEALADSHQPFRLRIVPTSGAEHSGRALDAGLVSLAILRSDDTFAKEAQSVALLQRRALIMLSRKDRDVDSIADLKGRKVALVGGAGVDSSRVLFEHVLAHYRIGPDDISIVETLPVEAARAMIDQDLDALVLFANPAGQQARRIVRELMDSPGLRIGFLGAAGATALAARFRELQVMEIPAGIFGGAPLHPPKDIDSVAITHELVARAALSDDTVAKLTGALMSIRSRLQKPGESEFIMETPPLDEPRRFVPHTGTANYVNDETRTFLEVWSDTLWLGLFGFSILGTSITGMLAWIGVKPRAPSSEILRNLPATLDELDAAETETRIDEIEKRVEGFVKTYVRDVAGGRIDLDNDTDPGPILRLVPELVARRRAELRSASASNSVTPTT